MENLGITMDALFQGIYTGKKVFITGHTGFKGSWLSLWLTKLGARVIGYSIDIPTKPSHFELLNLGVTSIEGDVLDKKKLLATIKKYKPDEREFVWAEWEDKKILTDAVAEQLVSLLQEDGILE